MSVRFDRTRLLGRWPTMPSPVRLYSCDTKICTRFAPTLPEIRGRYFLNEPSMLMVALEQKRKLLGCDQVLRPELDFDPSLIEVFKEL